MTTTTQTARELALANDQAKRASASAPKSVTPKRASVSNAKSATKTKQTTTKTTTAKRPAVKQTAPKSAPKQTGPSERSQRHDVIVWTVTTACDAFFSLPTKTVKGTKLVTVNGTEVPYVVALYAVKQTLAYIPADAWDKRLGARDIGRLKSKLAA